MEDKIIYKVYCGSNGKWYTYYKRSLAEELYFRQVLQNYRSQLVEFKNGKSTLLLDYKG